MAVPHPPRRSTRGMVVAADQLASVAGAEILGRGGTAGDAAVAAAAVMAVVAPHLCGMGGDMLAMVHTAGERPSALLGVGRAGSGADPDQLRRQGHVTMPVRLDVRTVTVPRAVDGWLAIHGRLGRLPWAEVLGPAIGVAEDGFPASILLALASGLLAGTPAGGALCPDGPPSVGQRVRRPALAATLRSLATGGYDAFYRGAFGAALVELGGGHFTADDLAGPGAVWATPLCRRVWAHDVWTVPPPSQGYLTLAGAVVAERAGVPADPDDPEWPHLMVETTRAVGHDRPARLHDGAEGEVLLSEERLAAAVSRIDRARAAPPDVVAGAGGWPRAGGDTTHLCALDAEGNGVSLTQSNALDFGSHLVAGDTGVHLHNRGLGFSLEPGHPAELGPGRRPPHTLSPALVTRPDGSLSHLVGTMGGDAQPHILVQLLARLLQAGQSPEDAIAAPRLALDSPSAPPFRLWWGDDLCVRVEGNAPTAWGTALAERGHRVVPIGALDPSSVGCAQVIALGPDGVARGGADPRSPEGDAVGR